MTPFTNRVVAAGGIRMAVRDEGCGPAVVLCHGFPDLAFGWRHQVPALVAAGFRVLAPDQRGYGDTEAPASVEAYDIHHLTGDLCGLLDALGIDRAVFVGHDWGGLVAWMMPLLHPARTAGVIGVNTPYFPRPPAPPVQLFRMLFGESHYVVHFQEPGVADAALGRQVRRVFTQLVRGGVPLPDVAALVAADGLRNLVEIVEGAETLGSALLTEAELAVYVSAFERTGFTGGINWYRNLDRNWASTAAVDGAAIAVPSLVLTAEWDPVLRPEMAEPMKAIAGDLEIHMIPRCGHWTPAERPAELSALMVDWLTRRFAGGG